MSEAAAVTKKLLLYFPKCETEKPIVYHLVKDYDLLVNIFRAKVTPEEDGYLVLDVTGSATDIERAIAYITTFDVRVDEANKGVRLDEQSCTSCGNCLTHCPTDALAVGDRRTMQVVFDSGLCIECLSCIPVCPFRALRSTF
jgi:L-aspartate semialdehyde sulfurtransferase ferredoxin